MSPSEEKDIFNNFKKLYENFPKGFASFDDKPDVIFTTEDGETIGVEITEAYYDSKLKSSSEFAIKFNKEVLIEIQDDFNFTFILDIELNPNFPIKNKYRESIIKELKELCKTEFSKLQNQETIKLENIGEIDSIDKETKELIIKSGYRDFHQSITSITMTRFDNLTKSHHFEINTGVIPDFNDSILNKIIETKEKSLLNYKNCDHNWLIISEGMDFYSYFGEISFNNIISSKFDKIFLMRRFQSRIITVK